MLEFVQSINSALWGPGPDHSSMRNRNSVHIQTEIHSGQKIRGRLENYVQQLQLKRKKERKG